MSKGTVLSSVCYVKGHYRQVCYVKGYCPIVRRAMSKGTVLSSGVLCQRALSYRQVCHVKGYCPIVSVLCQSQVCDVAVRSFKLACVNVPSSLG